LTRPGTIKYCVASEDRITVSYAWRIWAGGTSFYLKPLESSVGTHKVSLHGPDASRPNSPWLKLDVDRDAPKSEDCVSIAMGLPLTFTGRRISQRTVLAIRFRATWDLFLKSRPSAPLPSDPKDRDLGLLVTAPKAPYAADLDVYICRGRAFWPAERRARRDNACLGPLVNRADQHLTAVSVRRSLIRTPTPPQVLAGQPDTEDDRVRGVGAVVAADGILWICEQWMSRSALIAARDKLADSQS
jgi:hypothetical protein